MRIEDLVPGCSYKMKDGEIVEFSRIGGTGWPIFHPPGEPDMQSSFAIDPAKLDCIERKATFEEASWPTLADKLANDE